MSAESIVSGISEVAWHAGTYATLTAGRGEGSKGEARGEGKEECRACNDNPCKTNRRFHLPPSAKHLKPVCCRIIRPEGMYNKADVFYFFFIFGHPSLSRLCTYSPLVDRMLSVGDVQEAKAAQGKVTVRPSAGHQPRRP